jgi:hypothetical protein
MKTLSVKSIGAMLLLCPVLLSSCKKENAALPPQDNIVINAADINDADAPGVYNNSPAAGYTKLVLQPGDGVGQDAWIDWFNGADSALYNNGNSGSIDQIKCLAWTMFGGIIKTRTLIRFDELSEVPSSKHVVAAKLFLYGLASSDIHLPQGNSYYPGSPYNSYGPNDAYVQRVTSGWDESAVTWNTKPSSTVADESLIPPSTSQWNYRASPDVTKIIRPMVSNPSRNYGFMLVFTNENIYHSMGFCSSENTDATKHPKLVVVYKN